MSLAKLNYKFTKRKKTKEIRNAINKFIKICSCHSSAMCSFKIYFHFTENSKRFIAKLKPSLYFILGPKFTMYSLMSCTK